jgi:hypothetical protein
MRNKDNKSNGQNIVISSRPDMERPAPDKGRDESETNVSLIGSEIPDFPESEYPDEGYKKINGVGGDEEEDDDDDDEDDDDIDDVDDDDEEEDDDDIEDSNDVDESLNDIEDIDEDDFDDDDDDDLEDVDEEIDEAIISLNSIATL